jgi:hypothetical protein
VQGSLVDDRPGEGCCAVAVVTEREAVEPVTPVVVELPGEADLILLGFTVVVLVCVW